MDVHIHPLHERRDFTEQCIEVINDEWPRSKAIRLHSLEKSCSGLPYSLVMTVKQVGNTVVVGYCRLAKVLAQKKSVLIETVVVDKSRRGQGLGRKLMQLALDHARQSGYKAMYLCTKDKEKFYEHLGFQFCEPVNTLGAMMLESCDCAPPDTNTPLPCGDSETIITPGCGRIPCSPPGGVGSTHTIGGDNSHTYSKSTQERRSIPSELQGTPSKPPPPPPPPPPPLPKPSGQAPVIYWMMRKLNTP